MKSFDELADAKIGDLILLDAERAHRQRVERLLRSATADECAKVVLRSIDAFCACNKVSAEWGTLAVTLAHPDLLAYLGADVSAERYRASGETGIDG